MCVCTQTIFVNRYMEEILLCFVYEIFYKIVLYSKTNIILLVKRTIKRYCSRLKSVFNNNTRYIYIPS